MDSTLTPEEGRIIELTAQGLTRWAIAERMGVNENTVRQYIRALCERYNCPMRDLPTAAGYVAEPGADEDEEEFSFLPGREPK